MTGAQTLAPLCLLLLGSGKAAPAFGAIRWDCWNGRTVDVISTTVAKVMAPEKYHWRLPWYAKVSNSSVTFDADEQTVMDAELKLASSAGLSFWAYDTYCIWPGDAHIPQCQGYWGKDPSGYGPTSLGYKARDPAYALKLHLKSKLKHLMNFSLVLLGAAPATPALRPRYLKLLRDPSFQRTRSNRPLVFLFQASDQEANMNGGWEAWAKQWRAFREESISQGSGDPYFVAMTVGDASGAIRVKNLLGFDAVSAYALPGGTTEGLPFSDLAAKTQKFWADAIAANESLVPPVPTGWDPRPRADHPPVWVKEGPQHYVEPSPAEITSLFRDARSLVEREALGESDAAIAYAWDENSEGGWLLPTKGEGHSRLQAVSDALTQTKSVSHLGHYSQHFV